MPNSLRKAGGAIAGSIEAPGASLIVYEGGDVPRGRTGFAFGETARGSTESGELPVQ
jgi:hypothetical protein